MANPQTENGFIKISTELFKALRSIRINGEAAQVLFFIIEKTYGWNKKEDLISISQFHEATGINKPNIIRATKKLVDMNIVIKKDNANGSSYSIQKDYDKWNPLSKKITIIEKDNLSKKITDVIQKDNKPLSKKINTKDTSKDTRKDRVQTTKNIKDFAKQNPDSLKIVKHFLETLDEDSLYRPKTPAQKLKWLQCAQWAINKMGKHGDEKVIDIIEWFRDPENSGKNGFTWADNFQSLLKLRKKNAEEMTYLEYFYEQIKSEVEYGTKEKKIRDPGTDRRM